MPKYAVITGFLGQTKDRFHVYNENLSVEQKFELAKSIPGYDGVEVVFPYEVNDAALTTKLLQKHKLDVSAVNVNIKAEPEFLQGSLTSPDKAIRNKAIQFIKDAKDFAIAIGAPRVTCCPLGDGYEFPFSCDYQIMWKRLVNGFGEAGAHKSEMPLFIEYKPKETRGRCFINRAEKTLCLLNEIKNPALGITVDYGHAIYADEHPAEVICLLEDSPYPYYIHINDNDRTWDWDYFCGSHTLLDYIEFLYYLKKFNYTDYITSDTHPTRWDLVGTFEVNARITEKIWKLLDRVGLDEIEKKINHPDYLVTWKFVEEELLGLR